MCNIELYSAIGRSLDYRSRGRGFESPLILSLHVICCNIKIVVVFFNQINDEFLPSCFNYGSGSKYPIHAYQSLACETAINTDFSELFSLKRIYVKYKNAILSLIDSFFCIWKDKTYGQVLSQIFNYYGETRSQDRTNQLSRKVQAYLSHSSICRESNLYVIK